MSRPAIRLVMTVMFPVVAGLTAMLSIDSGPSVLDWQARSSVRSPGESGASSKGLRILRVIPPPPPDSRIIVKRQTGTLLFRGRADLNLECGNCRVLLASGVSSGQLLHIVLVCNACGSFNDTEECTGSGPVQSAVLSDL